MSDIVKRLLAVEPADNWQDQSLLDLAVNEIERLRALADDAADILANLATPMGRPLEETRPDVKRWLAHYREARPR